MVATPSRKRLILPMAPAAGAVIGLVAAALCALIPGNMLDRFVLRSGLPAVLAAAEPPLGLTARLVLILIGGGSIGLLAWFALFLLVGSRTVAIGAADSEQDSDNDVPVLRRADAHPDAPSRRPVFANRDLGTPFLEVRAPEAPVTPPAALITAVAPSPLPPGIAPDAIPANLDLPLSAFDPAAIVSLPPAAGPVAMPAPPLPAIEPATIAAPLAPPRLEMAPPLPALMPVGEPPARRQIFEPGERFETFPLDPVPVASETPSMPAPRRAPRDTQATINALLERLERGVSDRAGRLPAEVPVVAPARPSPASEPTFDDNTAGLERTLGVLRQLATRG